jgi:hypothetical protein
MINKVTLTEFYKDTFRRSTLISIPNLSDFFDIPDSPYTKWEVFYGIVRDALQTFEYYYPLNLIQQIYLEVDQSNRIAKVTGNFPSFIKGIIDEDQIVIVPSSVQGIGCNGYTSIGYPLRNFRYEPPEFRDFWYCTGKYWVNSLCNRPIYEEYNEVTKDPTDNCAVYYMTKDVGSEYKVFRDQLYVEVCRYILNMKKNMSLGNLPIDLFQGLEEDMQDVKGKLDNTYQSALTNGAWLV